MLHVKALKDSGLQLDLMFIIFRKYGPYEIIIKHHQTSKKTQLKSDLNIFNKTTLFEACSSFKTRTRRENMKVFAACHIAAF